MIGTVDKMPKKTEEGKERDFTFIMGEDGKSYFLHITEFKSAWPKLVESLPRKVEFTPTDGKKGKKAMNCDFVKD